MLPYIFIPLVIIAAIAAVNRMIKLNDYRAHGKKGETLKQFCKRYYTRYI